MIGQAMNSDAGLENRNGPAEPPSGFGSVGAGLTRDLERAKRDLAETGLALVEGVLDRDALASVRDTLYRVAKQDRHRGRIRHLGADPDELNQRIWNLLSRDPVFCDLAEHPAALAMIKSVLGWPVLLSNMSANITGPGGGEMVLHADQGLSPTPWASAHGVNIIWCLDDFTEESGATRIVPGSHRANRQPGPNDSNVATVPLTAPAGTMIAMDGRIWHKTGANRTHNTRRAGIFAWYTLPIYIPQENWWLSLDPAVRQFGSETLLELLGFRGKILGLVNGQPIG
jgi:ectoine hydroxylase-related dioxygenase (phytanoyl-CoA dioxygenase family)